MLTAHQLSAITFFLACRLHVKRKTPIPLARSPTAALTHRSPGRGLRVVIPLNYSCKGRAHTAVVPEIVCAREAAAGLALPPAETHATLQHSWPVVLGCKRRATPTHPRSHSYCRFYGRVRSEAFASAKQADPTDKSVLVGKYSCALLIACCALHARIFRK